MKFFKISYDTESYSLFMPVGGYGEDHFALRYALFSTRNLGSEWHPREFIRVDPNRPVPDFIDCGGLEIAMTPRVLEIGEMRNWFHSAGELLPITLSETVDGSGGPEILQRLDRIALKKIGNAFFGHCVRTLDAVNLRRSKGTRGAKGWAFSDLVLKPITLTETTIFKAAGCSVVVLADTMDGTARSFRSVYERERLTGLKFVELPVIGRGDGPHTYEDWLELSEEQRVAFAKNWNLSMREGIGLAYAAAGRLIIANSTHVFDVRVRVFTASPCGYLIEAYVDEDAVRGLPYSCEQIFEGFPIVWFPISRLGDERLCAR